MYKIYRKKNLKIITRLDNFDLYKIIEVSNAADIAGATYLDIATDNILVKELKKNTLLPICVSSISLKDLYLCVVEGVDMLEIGNYNVLYQQGIFLSKQYILNLAKEAIKLFPGLDICVTIPYMLSLNEQIQLSCQLESVGIQILQTESLKVKSMKRYSNLTKLINISLPVLSSTYAISKIVKIPIISSSGVNYIIASLALLYGASVIGICTPLLERITSFSKVNYINEILKSVYCSKTISNITFSIQDCSSLLK